MRAAVGRRKCVSAADFMYSNFSFYIFYYTNPSSLSSYFMNFIYKSNTKHALLANVSQECHCPLCMLLLLLPDAASECVFVNLFSLYKRTHYAEHSSREKKNQFKKNV